MLDKLLAHKKKAAGALMALLVVLVGYLSPETRKTVFESLGVAPVASEAK